MLLLELFMGVDRLRQLLGQLASGSPRQLQLATQGIEGRLQVIGLCTEGASAFIFQLEAGKPGLGLQLLQATQPGTSLVELPLQPGQLLLPLLLAQAGLFQLLAGVLASLLLLGEQLLTLLQPSALLLGAQYPFGQLILLAGKLRLAGGDPLTERLCTGLPVAPQFTLVQLLLLETGDGLPAKKNLLLTARLLGLRLLSGDRQGDVAPLIGGALGIERRQRLLGLRQFGFGLAKARLQRPQLGANQLGTSSARTTLELFVALGRFGLGL